MYSVRLQLQVARTRDTGIFADIALGFYRKNLAVPRAAGGGC